MSPSERSDEDSQALISYMKKYKFPDEDALRSHLKDQCEMFFAFALFYWSQFCVGSYWLSNVEHEEIIKAVHHANNKNIKEHNAILDTEASLFKQFTGQEYPINSALFDIEKATDKEIAYEILYLAYMSDVRKFGDERTVTADSAARAAKAFDKKNFNLADRINRAQSPSKSKLGDG